jgi:hypothetical protein
LLATTIFTWSTPLERDRKLHFTGRTLQQSVSWRDESISPPESPAPNAPFTKPVLVVTWDPSGQYVTPTIYQWNLTLEHQLAPDRLVRGAYVATRSTIQAVLCPCSAHHRCAVQSFRTSRSANRISILQLPKPLTGTQHPGGTRA